MRGLEKNRRTLRRRLKTPAHSRWSWKSSAARLPDYPAPTDFDFPYRQGSQFAYWASRPKAGKESARFTPIRRFRPRKFFIRKNILLDLKRRAFFFPRALAAPIERQPARRANAWANMLLRGLDRSRMRRNSPSVIAAGWRGDQLFAFPKTAELRTVWFSSWERSKKPPPSCVPIAQSWKIASAPASTRRRTKSRRRSALVFAMATA